VPDQNSRIATGYPGEEKPSLLRRLMGSDVLQAFLLVVSYTLLASIFFLVLTWLVYNKRYGVTLEEYFQMLF